METEGEPMSWDNRAEDYAKKNMKSVITNDAKDAYTIGVVDGQRFARKELLSRSMLSCILYNLSCSRIGLLHTVSGSV